MKLIEHKNEVLAAVIGALVAGMLSFAVGLYSLNKTFQITQSKELVNSLKSDISILRNVDREIDDNIKLLLSNNYQIKVELETYELNFPMLGTQKKDQDFSKWMKEYMQSVGGKRFIVKILQVPTEKFVIGAWPTDLSSSSDIDFELAQALTELHRNLKRANAFLEQISPIVPKSIVFESTKDSMEKSIPKFNTMIAEITQSKLVQIKNRVTEEIKKLQMRRDEISF